MMVIIFSFFLSHLTLVEDSWHVKKKKKKNGVWKLVGGFVGEDGRCEEDFKEYWRYLKDSNKSCRDTTELSVRGGEV